MTQTNTEQFTFKIDIKYLKEHYLNKLYTNNPYKKGINMDIDCLKTEIIKSIPYALRALYLTNDKSGYNYAKMFMRISGTPICQDIYLMLNNHITIKAFKDFMKNKFDNQEVVVTDVTLDTDTGLVNIKCMLLTEFEKNKDVVIVTLTDIMKSLNNVILNDEGEEL